MLYAKLNLSRALQLAFMLAMLAASASSSTIARAGILQSARDDVRSRSSSSDDDDDDYDSCDDDDESLGQAILGGFFKAIFSPKKKVPCDDPPPSHWQRLDDPSFVLPRQPDLDTYQEQPELGEIEKSLKSHPYSRFEVTYGNNTDELQWVGGHLLAHMGVGIDTQWDYFDETIGDEHDQLWIGDFNLILGFPISERGNFYAGIGFNWLDDEFGTDLGGNLTIGGDYFPREHLVWTGVLDIGTLGHTSYFHGRTTIGLKFDHVELFTGYEHYHIGGTPIDGLLAGVRIWF